MVDKVARGGNLLLNIGPTADGRIPVIMQQRLKDIGDWLAVNGEAIYDTRRWADSPKGSRETGVYFTRKGRNLYAIYTRWPTAPLQVSGINTPVKISLPGFNGNVPGKNSRGGVRIMPPAVNPATMPCQHAWVVKLEQALKLAE